MSSVDDSDAESFRSADNGKSGQPLETPQHFSPEEEASLLASSNDTKSLANFLFAQASYAEAIQKYDQALSYCPSYLEYDVAVLKANVAACYLKLKEWKEAVESATASLECLERLDPTVKPVEGKNGGDSKGSNGKEVDDAEGKVHEIDDETAESIEALEKSGRSRADIEKMMAKALMRRAKAREELGSWGELQGAEEDYKRVSKISSLSPTDLKTVGQAQQRLPMKINTAKEREMGEMMGKLKDLGNGILKPFGLSTDNFQFTKDENSGGYSMNFNQNAGQR